MQMYLTDFQQTITHVEETNSDTHLSKVLEHSATLAGCEGAISMPHPQTTWVAQALDPS